MSVKLANDGSVVEDTIIENSANALSDLYALIHQNAAKVAYAVAGGIDDEQAKQWADALQTLTLDGHRLGAVQAKATDFSMRSYHKFVDVGSSIPTAAPSDAVLETLEEQNILGNVDKEIMWETVEDIQMPVSPEGEMLPLLVTSNETSEATPTFEEALPILEDVVSHIEGVQMDEINTTEEESTDSSTDEDSEKQVNPINDPTWIDGVGPATVQKLESAGYEIRATDETFEAFESDDYFDGSYDEQSLRDRLNDIREDMAEQLVITVEAYIEQDFYEKAEGAIEAFETMD